MIEIDKKWAIGADTLNILLLRRGPTPKKEGAEPNWTTVGYYSSFHKALHGMVEQGIRDTKLASVKMLADKPDETYSLIKTLNNITVEDLRGED